MPDATLKHFDLLNVMAYDAAGHWSPDQPGQHSSLGFAKENIRYWLFRGVSKDRLVLGVPFDGYGFGKAFRTRDDPYKEIVRDFPGAEKVDEVGETIWYNGIPTMREKCQLVRAEEVAGIMIWSLNLDAEGDQSLLRVIDQEMRTKDGWEAPPE